MNRFYPLGAVLILGLSSLLLSSCSEQVQGGLDEAMQQYLNIVKSGSTASFMQMVPREGKVRFVSISAVKKSIIGSQQYTYEEIVQQFREKKGFYYAIFKGTPRYSYRNRLVRSPFNEWKRIGTSFSIDDEEMGHSYVRWVHKEEEDRWYLQEIGDAVLDR